MSGDTLATLYDWCILQTRSEIVYLTNSFFPALNNLPLVKKASFIDKVSTAVDIWL